MTTTTNTTSCQLSTKDRVIKGMLDTKELSFVNHVMATYDFSNAGRWSTLETRITSDLDATLKPNCNLVTLEKIIDRVISSADHTYRIIKLTPASAAAIRNAISSIDMANHSSMYQSFYPMKIEFSPGASYSEGEKLCKVADLGDGYACIFSSVFKELKRGHIAPTYEQHFHTVFVPKSSDRIELRISNSLSPTMILSSFFRLEQEFINVINISGTHLPTFVPLNIYDSIESLFNDVDEGRVQFAMMTTSEDGDDADLNGRNRKNYCARKVDVSDSINNHEYICRGLRIRYAYSTDDNTETELSVMPHKRDWTDRNCFQFSIKHPKDSFVQSEMVNKIINRS
ncbi:hypothetical protein [Aliivibrio fischeri]|uniref:hypothetical protein n=1 Tax=Aliivibrio fischeri TaxID=668 RepID=UPI001F257BEA|nr:hypothetical protein [Aliivibrio fischeri]MCE7534837.1 hypothetical protein [Aliivibrio fischeri]MCE7557327.1 hypothetical protein [Aliivibrio fischeri]